MAYAKKTLSDLKQSLADKIASGEVPTDSTELAYWTRVLNDGQQYCADKLRLTKSTSLTTTGATSSTAGSIVLPDDFILINKVVDADGNEFTQISQEESLNYVNNGGDVFWITGNHFDDFYLKTPENATYTVYYTFRPSEMSSNSDECIIPDPLAVVCYAYSKLRMAQTDPLEDADKEMGECNRRLDEVMSARIFNENGGLRMKLQTNA